MIKRMFCLTTHSIKKIKRIFLNGIKNHHLFGYICFDFSNEKGTNLNEALVLLCPELLESADRYNQSWIKAGNKIFINGEFALHNKDTQNNNFLKIYQQMLHSHANVCFQAIVISISAKQINQDDSELSLKVTRYREIIIDFLRILQHDLPIVILLTHMELLDGFADVLNSLAPAQRETPWGIIFPVDRKGNKNLLYKQLQLFYANIFQLYLAQITYQAKAEIKLKILIFISHLQYALDQLFISLHEFDQLNVGQYSLPISAIFLSGTEQIKKQLTVKKTNQSLAMPAKRLFFKESIIYEKLADISANYNTQLNFARILRQKRKFLLMGVCLLVINWSACQFFFQRSTMLLKNDAILVSQLVSKLKENPTLSIEDISFEMENLLWQFYLLVKARFEKVNHTAWYSNIRITQGKQSAAIVHQILMNILHYQFSNFALYTLETSMRHLVNQWQNADLSSREQMRGDFGIALAMYLKLLPVTRNKLIQNNWILFDQIDFLRDAKLIIYFWKKIHQSCSIGNINNMAEDKVKRITLLLSYYLQHRLDNKGRHQWQKQSLINNQLIETVSSQLANSPSYVNAYAMLKAYANIMQETISQTEWLHKIIKSDLFVSETKGFPAFYTTHAWQKYVLSLCDRMTARNQLQELLQLYFTDYRHVWLELLKNIQILPAKNLPEVITQLNFLIRPDSPLLSIVKNIQQQFSVANISHQGWLNNVSAIDILSLDYRQLQKLTGIGLDLKNSALQEYFQQISRTRDELQQITNSEDSKREASYYVKKLLSGEGKDLGLYQAALKLNLAVAHISDKEFKMALFELLSKPMQISWQALIGEASQALENQWQLKIYNMFKQNLSGKYPFADTQQDALLNDVEQFFNPQHGVLWSWINQELLALLIHDQAGWHDGNWQNFNVNLSPDFLAWLNKVNTFIEAYFPQVSEKLSYRFEIYPIPSPQMKHMQLSINNDTYVYQNGPQEWQTVHWPAENINTPLTAELQGLTTHGNEEVSIETQGGWALQRLLAKAHLSLMPSNLSDHCQIMDVLWQSKTLLGKRASFHWLIKQNNFNNLLDKEFFKQLEPPHSLFKLNP